MGKSTVFEALNVVSNGIRSDPASNRPLLKHFRIVNPLSATEDFLAPHEEIVGASVPRVILAKSCVEGTGTDGVSVEHIEVSVIFFADYINNSVLISPRRLSV